jgi:hypothetical protein
MPRPPTCQLNLMIGVTAAPVVTCATRIPGFQWSRDAPHPPISSVAVLFASATQLCPRTAQVSRSSDAGVSTRGWHEP